MINPGIDVSARAWGIYCHAMASPDRLFTVSGLVPVFTEGRDALTTAAQELVDAGLAQRKRWQEGNLVRVAFVVHEVAK
jgi:hypothetical protein